MRQRPEQRSVSLPLLGDLDQCTEGVKNRRPRFHWRGVEARPQSQAQVLRVRLRIEQDDAPVAAARTVDQHDRHMRSVFLKHAAVSHLAVARFTNLIVTIAVLDPLVDPGFDIFWLVQAPYDGQALSHRL